MNSVNVKAPATTANLGPGYDCLGMALDLWNELEVRLLESEDLSIFVKGFGLPDRFAETAPVLRVPDVGQLN